MSKKSTTSTSAVTIPPEVLARYNAVNQQAQNVAATPFQQWGQNASDFVAQINPQQQQGIDATNAAAGSYQPYFDQATQATQAGMGAVNPGQLNIDQYMSPYVRNVADTTAQIMGQQNEQAQSGALGTAASSGAFGGDRAGIAAANLSQQQNLAMGSTMANIMNQGYGQALGAAQQQQGVQLGAEQANLARQMQGGQQLAGLGTAAQQLGLQGAEAQIGAGTLQQQTEQAGKTALINQFMQQQGYPFQVAQFLANIAEGTGALSGSTTTTTQPAPFFSDRRLKHDIKKIATANNGEPIYSFKYKGHPETHIGFMADQVEKRHPEAVGLDPSGYKTVDYERAAKAGGGAMAPYSTAVGSAPGLGSYVPSAYLPVGDLLMADPNLIDQAQQGMAQELANAAAFGESLKSLKGNYDWLKGLKEKPTPEASGGAVEYQQKAGLGYMAPVMDAQRDQPKPQLMQAPAPGQQQSGLGQVVDLAAKIIPFFLKNGGRTGYDGGGLIYPQADASAEAAQRGLAEQRILAERHRLQAETPPVMPPAGFVPGTASDALVNNIGARNAAAMRAMLQAEDRANGFGGYEGGARAEAQPAPPEFNPWMQPDDVIAPAFGIPEQPLPPEPPSNDRAGPMTGLGALTAEDIDQAASPVRSALKTGLNMYGDVWRRSSDALGAGITGLGAAGAHGLGMGISAAGFPEAGQPLMDTGQDMGGYAASLAGSAFGTPGGAMAAPAPPNISAQGILGAGLGMSGAADVAMNAVRPDHANLAGPPIATSPAGLAPPVDVLPPMTNQSGLAVPPVMTPEQRQTAEGTPPNMGNMSGNDFFGNYIVRQESGGHQFDRNGNPLTSSAGAVGVAQVMEGTGPEAARLAGMPWDRNRWLNDKAYNYALGEAYYNDQLKRFGDPLMAAAAYNAGPGAVAKAIDRATALGGSYLDYLPAETKDYVRSISGMSGTLGPVSERSANQNTSMLAGAPETMRSLLINPETGKLDKNALLSILSGIGTMASSPSRYLGAAALQGLGGFANTYAGLQKQAADIGSTQAGTRLTDVQADVSRFFTAGPNGMPMVMVPGIGPVPLGDFIANPNYQARFSPDQVAAIKASAASEAPTASGSAPGGLFDSPVAQQAFADERTAMSGGDYQAQVSRSADLKAEAATAANTAVSLRDPTVEQMRAVSALISDPSAAGSGYAGQLRAQVANVANTVLRGLGADYEIASNDTEAQILNKVRNGAALLQAAGADQSSVEALNAIAAGMPNAELTPVANAQIMSAIMMSQQKAVDRNRFYADYAAENPYRTVLNADKLFMSQLPRYDQERDALAALMKIGGAKDANGGPSIMERLTSGDMTQDQAQSLLDYALQGKAPPGLYRYFVPAGG